MSPARILDATAGATPATAAAIAAACDAVAAGAVIGLPTETVYGLAADPWRAGATDRLFAVKGRPRDVVLPLLVAGADQALALAGDVSGVARRLMARWWPGPLTLVLPAGVGAASADLGGDGTTVGVRCPDHPVARAVCRGAGPLALTSANRHGRPPVTTAAELADGLAGVTLVLDAGVCAGEPSAVVDVTGAEPRLVRAGALDWEALRASAQP